MTFNNYEKGNKKYYEEIMYISSNYYIFKKRPKTKAHSLVKVFIFYIILFSLIFLSCLFIPNLYVISVIAYYSYYLYLFISRN